MIPLSWDTAHFIFSPNLGLGASLYCNVCMEEEEGKVMEWGDFYCLVMLISQESREHHAVVSNPFMKDLLLHQVQK